MVLGARINDATARLRNAAGRDAVYEAALDLRAWETVKNDLERIPKEYEDELIEEGDIVYG
jgi:hypothetical protein